MLATARNSFADRFPNSYRVNLAGNHVKSPLLQNDLALDATDLTRGKNVVKPRNRPFAAGADYEESVLAFRLY